MIPTTSSLYDLSHTLAAPLLRKTVYPWEALDGIRAFVLKLGETLPADEYDHPQPDVWIAKDVKIAPTASITGPCIWQGPHHSAQKSTRTGTSDFNTSASKFFSVIFKDIVPFYCFMSY